MEPTTQPDPATKGEERAYRKGLKHGIDKGLREGFEKGIRMMLLEILHARKIALTAMDRRQIVAESSTSRMRHWMRRALVARSAADVFGPHAS